MGPTSGRRVVFVGLRAVITQGAHHHRLGDRIVDDDVERRTVAVRFAPLDVDARALNLEKAVSIDSVEFESQPDIKKLLGDLQAYVPISEDEFELLAELLTEASEDEEEVELDEETEEVFDD